MLVFTFKLFHFYFQVRSSCVLHWSPLSRMKPTKSFCSLLILKTSRTLPSRRRSGIHSETVRHQSHLFHTTRVALVGVPDQSNVVQKQFRQSTFSRASPWQPKSGVPVVCWIRPCPMLVRADIGNTSSINNLKKKCTVLRFATVTVKESGNFQIWHPLKNC